MNSSKLQAKAHYYGADRESRLDRCPHDGGSCENIVVIVIRYTFSKRLFGVCAQHMLLYPSAGYERFTREEATICEVMES